MDTERITHAFEPVYDSNSRILVLGTMPSPKSRENGFYYSHPQNRFWKVLSRLFDEPFPSTTKEKRELALCHGVALWDVLARCDIKGADDSSIRNPVANDIGGLLKQAPINGIFATGATAARLYRKLVFPITGRDCISLPSTSPANCRYSLDMLCGEYQILLKYLEG